MSATRERVVVNLGCGSHEASSLPSFFDAWRQLRVDVDPSVEPDIIADLVDLSAIPSGSADAVWASHCIEHLFAYQVPLALREFRRILSQDGFVCVIVPDLQSVASYVAEDRMHEPLYESPAGPVTAHDIFFGFGSSIEAGNLSMAHRCGFTPSIMQRIFEQLPFGETLIHRSTHSLELVALARVRPATDEGDRERLLAELNF